MKIAVLDERHPTYDAASWAINRAFYSGGDALLKSPILDQVLIMGAYEPAQRYLERKRRAHYVNHYAGIVDQLVAGLSRGDCEVQSQPEQVDPWYSSFREDCDRAGSDVRHFLADRLRESLHTQHGWTLVELPARGDAEPASRADEEAAGLRRAYLVALPSESVIDWERGEDGRLLWAVVRAEANPRPAPTQARNLKTITWTVYTPTQWQRFQWIQAKQGEEPNREEELQLVAEGAHSFGQVPLVDLALPDGLFLGGKAQSHIREAFNQRCSLAWASYASLHATVVLKTKEEDLDTKLFGSGYGIRVDPEDSVEYLEPVGTFAQIAQASIAELKDELYRVVHQMALSADSSAGAMSRSGESKAQDQDATDVVLGLYARFEAKAHEEILDLVSRGRGDGITWSVSPADTFGAQATADQLADVTQAQAISVPSKTFTKALYMKAVTALFSDASAEELEQIRSEVAEAVDSGAVTRLEAIGGLAPGEPIGAEASNENNDAEAAAAGLRANGYGGGAPMRGAPGPREVAR